MMNKKEVELPLLFNMQSHLILTQIRNPHYYQNLVINLLMMLSKYSCMIVTKIITKGKIYLNMII